MIAYEVNLEKENIVIELKGEKKKCIFCGGDTEINIVHKGKLNNKKLFYDGFNETIKFKYRRRRCKCCKKTFLTYYYSDIKDDLIKRKKEIQKLTFKKMFEQGILKYDELEEREIEILRNENIDYKKYRALERVKKSTNQFNNNMIKVMLINLEDFEIKELRYKEIIKKNYYIK